MYNDSTNYWREIKLSLELDIPSILCIGETLEQRESNATLELLTLNSKRAQDISESEYGLLIVAYEPVWAMNRKNS